MRTLILTHKPIKASIILLLALTLTIPIIHLQPATAQTSDGYYEKSFAWDYDGKHWTWNLSIPVALYDAYHEVPDARRTRQGPAGYGYLTTTKDYYINQLAEKLNETTNSLGYGSYDQVSFVLAFVQSLPYTSDSVTTAYDEYPRFPIETLVDDGGDCEDTSILFATLTLIMGYGTVYINPPDHYAVGILGDGLKGTYWEHPTGSNKTYYYCETTGNNFKIGQLPEEFSGQNAYIYEIDESKQFVPTNIVIPTAQATPTDAPVTTTNSPTHQPTASPDVTDPNLQQPKPLSFNLITENPALFFLIIFAIVGSIAIAIWSTRRSSLHNDSAPPLPPPSMPSPPENSSAESGKYCIYCGAGNKDYADFCVKCGKQQPNN